MKRKHSPRRRDRRTGLSPYAKHGKRETIYSGAYLEWHRVHAGKAARQNNAEGRAHG